MRRAFDGKLEDQVNVSLNCPQKAEESQKQTFIEVIHWSLHSVRSSTYGKNFLIKLVVSGETSSYFDAEHLGVTGVRFVEADHL